MEAAEFKVSAGVDWGLIYDVGMNNGQDTRFYLAQGYRVVAVEAEPTLVAAARERFAAEIAAGRLTIVHCAIAEREGTIPFWVFPDRNGWNTMDRLQAEQNMAMGFRYEVTDVTGRRFANILEEHGIPGFLKIDIEGADLACVDALAVVDNRPPLISLELARASADEAFELLARLYRLGYRRFKVVDQALNPSRPVRLASGAEFEFEMGSSGAFGSEAPGRWMDAYRTARRIEQIVGWDRWIAPEGNLRPWAWMVHSVTRLPAQWRTPRKWRRALTTGSWFDLHAALPEAAGARRGLAATAA